MDAALTGRTVLSLIGAAVIIAGLGLLVEGLTREPALRLVFLVAGAALAALYFRASQAGGLPSSYVISDELLLPRPTVHVHAEPRPVKACVG